MFGKLTVITGGMFAGKTTRLIKESKRANSIVVKIAMDTRYSSNSCQSHDGDSVEAIAVSCPNDLSVLSEYSHILFDEIQFFTAPYYSGDIVKTIWLLLKSCKDVTVSGLDMDWKGCPFDVTSRLLAMADQVVKLKARCDVCGKPASKTHKKTIGCDIVELGHSDIYEARCNRHWPIG